VAAKKSEGPSVAVLPPRYRNRANPHNKLRLLHQRTGRAVNAELTISGRTREPVLPAIDVRRTHDLRRVKALANAVLAGSLAILVVARALAERHPAFGFVAAFAEAAAIGGLADWYAVVALFRHPLGLPIPHTAIIPANQSRIGEKLGEFIERHFLDATAVKARLDQTDFAASIAAWLADRKRRADLARLFLRLLPDAIRLAESSGLNAFIGRLVQTELEAINLAAFAADALRAVTNEGRHQHLLDDIIGYLDQVLNKPQTLAAMREKFRTELPTLLRLYRADFFLLKKVAASATAFFDEVRANPNHPVRGEFDRLAVSFIERLEREPAFAARLAELKHDLLSRPEFGDLVAALWSKLKDFVDRSAAGKALALERHLADLFADIGSRLAADSIMRDQINRGIVNVATGLIAEHKRGVSSFIADQVKAWDTGQLVELIESNVGRDLQFIRFNGTLIGGLAGLLLYSAEALVRFGESFLRLV
jgi:uncharacterized membrane-anchored protein YjiN (DUF445 family)